MRLLCMVFLLIALNHIGLSQNVSMSTADKDTIVFGDLVQLQYTLSSIPPECKFIKIDLGNLRNLLYEQDSSLFEEKADFSLEFSDGSITDYFNAKDNSLIIPTDALSSRDGQSIVVPVKIFSFGQFQISPANLLNQADSILPTIAQPGSFIVLVPNHIAQDTSLQIADIKPIREVKAPILPWLLRALAVLLVIGILYYVYKRYMAKKEEANALIEHEVIVIPAHVKALEQLDYLRKSKIWELGETKQFQSKLTEIIRTYLEDRYHIAALEMTSDEIIKILQARGTVSKTWTGILDDILHIADLVKFAKAQPETNIHTEFLDKAVDFVETTKERKKND